jgi:hypothetical protein
LCIAGAPTTRGTFPENSPDELPARNPRAGDAWFILVKWVSKLRIRESKH